MKRSAEDDANDAGWLVGFASRLRTLSQAVGLTAAETHRRTGIPLSTIYASLSGSRLPSPEVLGALVTVWGGNEPEWQELRTEVEIQLATGAASGCVAAPPVANRRQSAALDRQADGIGAVARDGEATNVPAETVSSRLAELRRAAGDPSLRELATHTGLSASTLSRALTGKRLPPWRVVEKVSHSFGTPHDEVMALRQIWLEASRTERRQQPRKSPNDKQLSTHVSTVPDLPQSFSKDGSLQPDKSPDEPAPLGANENSDPWAAAWLLGDQLRQLRVERHKTLSVAAKAIGHSAAYLSRVERAETQPHLEDVRGLARFYDVTDEESRTLESHLTQKITRTPLKSAPIVQRMILGSRLRELRQASEVTLVEAGRKVGMSGSSLSRLEAGHRECRADEVNRLLSLYGVNKPLDRQHVMELLKNANQRPWWQDWSDVTARHLQTFVSFEATARRICTYEPRHLPTLLQTGEYARALSGARMPEATPSEVERLVEFHQKRVQRFEGSAEKKLICVIDELTLVRPYGDSGVMRRQIDRLIALADNPQFVMRIAELSRPNLPVMLGSTTFFEFDDKLLPEIVYAEHFDDASILQEAGQVHKWIMHFDRLRQVSLSREQSVHHLRKLREMLE